MNIVDYHRGSRGQPPNLVDCIQDLGSKTPPSVGGADPLGKVGGVGTYQGGKWRPTGWIWRSFHGKIWDVIETPATVHFGFGVSKVSHGQESKCFGPKSWLLGAFFGIASWAPSFDPNRFHRGRVIVHAEFGSEVHVLKCVERLSTTAWPGYFFFPRSSWRTPPSWSGWSGWVIAETTQQAS